MIALPANRTLALAGAALVFMAGAWLGWSARGWGARRAIASATQQANQIDTAAAAALAQGVHHVATAQGLDPAIEATHAAVGKSRARLQMDQAAHAAGAVRPVDGSATPAGPVAPVDVVVDRDKDQLITDLTQENTLLRAQNADLKTATVALQAAATGFQQSGHVYQGAAAKAALPEHPWALGAIYGTSQTWGAFVERDLGPFRAGVDVVRRVLPAGNATIDTTARLGWRFSWGVR